MAAALAAARTALYFAGLVGREDRVWASASDAARERAERWLSDSRLLTVAIQFYHTIASVVTVVSLVACNVIMDSGSLFLGVIVPGVLMLVLSEAFARLFARKYPVKALTYLDILLVWVHKTMLPIARRLDIVNARWRQAFGDRHSAEYALAQVI